LEAAAPAPSVHGAAIEPPSDSRLGARVCGPRYENFFVFAANGLKSDFAGHSNRHYRNVYSYVSNCWGSGIDNW
jgi:hypothetical protein